MTTTFLFSGQDPVAPLPPSSQYVLDAKAKEKVQPMPPDLTHVKARGCHIDGHGTDPPQFTIDAKTGEQHMIETWTVTPFATYEKLPDGTPREEWVPLDKKKEPLPIAIFVGTESHVPGEAVDMCSAWMKAMDKARLEEAHKSGK